MTSYLNDYAQFRYFDNPDLSDVILMVGEHRFFAHKFALSAQSEVFHEMLLVGNRCVNCPDFQKVWVTSLCCLCRFIMNKLL